MRRTARDVRSTDGSATLRLGNDDTRFGFLVRRDSGNRSPFVIPLLV